MPMTPTHTIHVDREIAAPAEDVWNRVSNHAETHTWVCEARVRVLSPGQGNPNGLGAVREVSFPDRPLWSTIEERVTLFEAPRTFSYKITRGMPGIRDHLGTLTVESLGPDRSKLVWHIDFEFSRWHPLGWFAGPFTRTFQGVLEQALSELSSQLGPRLGSSADAASN
jgi:hypothetical protein